MGAPAGIAAAFPPAVPLKVFPNDRGRGELLGGGGNDLTVDVVALRAHDSGQLDYLVMHDQLSQPRWITPNLVQRVVRA